MNNFKTRAEEIFEDLQRRGESAIRDFILTRQSEELFLDFKRSEGNGTGRRLADNDRKNLAKAVSGFGNSEGGVIVWGIDASVDTDGADVAKALVPIENPERFESWLQGAISGATIPAHSRVRNIQIKKRGSTKGYVATLIPKSDHAPHQSSVDLKYYMRAGSSFLPVPHSVLAGMFGRRPEPNLIHQYALKPAALVRQEDGRSALEGELGLLLSAKGPSICRDVYMNVMVSGPGKIEYSVGDLNIWTGHFAFDVKMCVISKDGFKLAPGAFVQPVTIHYCIPFPVNRHLELYFTFGCEGCPPRVIERTTSADAINALLPKMRTVRNEKAAQAVARKLFNLPVPSRPIHGTLQE